MIDKAGAFFEIIKVPAAILFGLGMALQVLDFLFGLTEGSSYSGSYAEQPAAGRARMARGRFGQRRAQRPPTYKDEPHYKTNSWQVLEDRAKTVNGYNPDDE